MSEQPPDHRLIYGAVIAAEMWFELEPLSAARTFGRDAAPEPGCVAFESALRPLTDIALEGPVKSLSALSGVVRFTSQRERTVRLGRVSRETSGYSVSIHLFEAELDRYLGLLAAGLTPWRLKLEFDIEVPQWFEVGDYWDDVRYPFVDVHEHVLDWRPLAGLKVSR